MIEIWASNDAEPEEERDWELEGEIWAIQHMPYYPDYITTMRSGNPAYKWGSLCSFLERRLDLDDYKDDIREKRKQKHNT